MFSYILPNFNKFSSHLTENNLPKLVNNFVAYNYLENVCTVLKLRKIHTRKLENMTNFQTCSFYAKKLILIFILFFLTYVCIVNFCRCKCVYNKMLTCLCVN